MQVILTPEDDKSLRQFIRELITSELQEARLDVGMDRPLNQKEIAEYLGVSTTTIREWEGMGMPFGSLGERTKYYDRNACKKWVLEQKL
ncbi:hypothetical protein [Vagococcus xieshaowenii]|uniref:Uncharacterized protein n=1 Tax=Vagococcus xieshaowenii TaxID=2562451 RepID=A0AAJ5EEG4_9ENTE|nr:hypothetical protein [Vagococcus xieshaowenii]QCA28227.1 hypothetical protein E4Z98_02440 [Vagococcus xieshaowenii]TFZ41882.1 hypothetical protein E4031_04620 [Vagococcus xieshaowenii]